MGVPDAVIVQRTSAVFQHEPSIPVGGVGRKYGRAGAVSGVDRGTDFNFEPVVLAGAVASRVGDPDDLLLRKQGNWMDALAVGHGDSPERDLPDSGLATVEGDADVARSRSKTSCRGIHPAGI